MSDESLSEESLTLLPLLFCRWGARVKEGRENTSMDFERYFAQGWKSVSSAAADSESFSGCFDCNICFDFAHEPVVTLCGHLYCWPCIYKWLHVQSASLASDEHPQCPVCKADISHATMVPLYGRGQGSTEAEGKAPYSGMIIPPRPSACGARGVMSNTSNTGQRLPYRNPYQSHNYNSNPYGSFEEASPSPLLNLGDPTMTGLQEPVAGMLREMVYARVFGAFPSSYHLTGTSSPRMRRHEMLAATYMWFDQSWCEPEHSSMRTKAECAEDFLCLLMVARPSYSQPGTREIGRKCPESRVPSPDHYRLGFRATYGVINKYISSTVALDVLRDGQMRIALGSTRGSEIYLELATATTSTARMKVVCIQSLGK
ncbi:hypothetical protein D5086_008037 [Populus alba]|uniref:Uncharacterized protein n=1 Tax=Populus alba TaxID=43335 RepID=A0ACC4CFV7_POPAL